MYCAHRPVDSVSLFFILSFLLVLFLWKSMVDYIFRNMLRSRPSWSNFWSSFFFIFFLKRAESHSAGLKVFCCYSIFYTSLFWFPEVLPTCAMRSRWFLPLFLAGSFDTWEGRDLSSISCVSFCLFLLNCLNLFLTVLTRLRDFESFGSLWGSQLNFIFQSSDMGFFSFSFFFSHKLLGFPFFSSWCFLGFKPLRLTISSLFFVALCAYFFGLGYCDFLGLNRPLPKGVCICVDDDCSHEACRPAIWIRTTHKLRTSEFEESTNWKEK